MHEAHHLTVNPRGWQGMRAKPQELLRLSSGDVQPVNENYYTNALLLLM
jgi:hypothetical protein